MTQEELNTKLLEEYSKNVIASNTDLKGVITYVSDAFCKISGYNKDELMGFSHNIVKHPEMSKDFFKKLWKTIANDEIFMGEIKNRRKDGSNYWVEVTISPTFDSSGTKVGYSAIRHDITQKKEFESLSTEHQKFLKEYSKYVIASKTDLEGNITYVSDAFCNISGFSREDLIGKNHNIVRHPDMNAAIFKELWRTIQAGKVYFGELKNRKKNGDYYWVEVAISPEFDDNSNIIGYNAIRHNVSQRKIVEDLMIIDPLTKIKNRQYYDRTIEKELDMLKRYNNKMSLMLLDIDYFKKINDTFGHDVGDSVLIEFSRLIENSIRKCDTFCRIGGEEFIIISPNSTNEQNYLFANKIREMIANHQFQGVGDVRVSIGVANCTLVDDKATLFKKADKALYQSKHSGRNRVTILE